LVFQITNKIEDYIKDAVSYIRNLQEIINSMELCGL